MFGTLPVPLSGTAAPSLTGGVHDVLAVHVNRPLGLILDLGCGPGAGLMALRHRWPRAHLVGVDLSPTALGGVRALPVGAGVVQADLTRPLPFADGVAAGVVCHNVTELLSDPGVVMGEARRVLRMGGRAVWSHTDFASLIIHGADQGLTRRVCAVYAAVPQEWMAHIDPRAGRRIPGMARRAGLTVTGFRACTLTSDRLSGHALRRVEEITQVVERHITQGRVAAFPGGWVRDWRAQLQEADTRGDFCFAETALITTTTATTPPARVGG